VAHFKHLTFLKVLSALAWADGELTHSEGNILKSFIRKLGLEKVQLQELKPYLEAPVSAERQSELLQTLAAELHSPKEKREILDILDEMARADKKVGAEEKAMLQQFRDLLERAAPTRRSIGTIRNLVRRALFSGGREKDPDLEKYFKRRVLKKLELKAAHQGHKINLKQGGLYFICLLGSLLSRVANVDDHLDEREKKALKRILSEKFSFGGKELTILIDVLEELAKSGFDFHEVVTEINRMVSYNDRIKLMESLFAVATADGEISHAESEEIRRITKALNISHQQFRAAKIFALGNM